MQVEYADTNRSRHGKFIQTPLFDKSYTRLIQERLTSPSENSFHWLMKLNEVKLVQPDDRNREELIESSAVDTKFSLNDTLANPIAKANNHE